MEVVALILKRDWPAALILITHSSFLSHYYFTNADGIMGMLALIFGYWFDTNYTYDHGVWLIPVCIAPGLLIGIISALSVQMVSVHESDLADHFCVLRMRLFLMF